MSRRTNEMTALLELSHQLGRPDLRMAILAEGNASARLDGGTFLVKASGAVMEQLGEAAWSSAGPRASSSSSTASTCPTTTCSKP